MLTELADVLRAAGLDVVEVPGWKTRGRPGAFNPKGVLCHHTAGPGDGYADALAMATKGRPDLSPPLAQLALSRKGTFYVLAAGRANHAGRCKAIGGLKPYPGETYGDGNEQMIGIEAQNRGTDAEDWSPAQYDAYVRGVAALTAHYRWSIVFGHKETSLSGKVDPDFNMDKFRRDVAATTPQGDDMPTMDELKAELLTKADGDTLRRDIGYARDQIRNDNHALRETVAAQAAALTSLALSKGVDSDAIVAEVGAAVRERLERIAITDDPAEKETPA